MARLCLSLLGPFQATLDGAPLTGFPSSKVRALLAYLAVESARRRPGTVAHPRQVLAGLLWPDYPDRSAHTNLSNALSHLRTLLRDRADTGGEYSSPVRPYLVVDRETVQFNADSDAWVDVLEFEGNLQPETQNTKLATPDSQLETCVRLYRGPFLDGFSVKDSPPFEQWTLLTRERLQRQALEALEALEALGKLSAHWEQRGEYRQALAYAQRQLDLEPWREGAHRQAMRALALSGQRDAALAQYQACVRALKDELDVAPAVETTRLWEQIRHGTLAVGTPRPKTETEARFLADWVVAEPGPRHNLPAQVTSFVGRERELIELSRMLAEPEVRLVTVVGPGGMGKTRLALQAPRAALDQAAVAEAWLVDLAPVVDGAAVERAVAAALGVHEQPGRLLPETIAGALQTRKLLLLLDNCEHVLEGAAPLVAQLLSRCPELCAGHQPRAAAHPGRAALRGAAHGLACPRQLH